MLFFSLYPTREPSWRFSDPTRNKVYLMLSYLITNLIAQERESWHSPMSIFEASAPAKILHNDFENNISKIMSTSLRTRRVKLTLKSNGYLGNLGLIPFVKAALDLLMPTWHQAINTQCLWNCCCRLFFIAWQSFLHTSFDNKTLWIYRLF